jgi:GDPmannose 4,6-dehydratase
MKAIVTGVTGQDGHFAAKLLVSKGYEVVGLTSRAGGVEQAVTELAGVTAEEFDYRATGAIGDLVSRIRPSLIMNFAAKATGRGMFDEPEAMARLNGGFVLDILEAIRTIDPGISFCQASSAEMFGDVEACPQNECTPFRPKSPYGAAKLYAHNLIGIYRRAFGLRAASAILYNHESVRRTTDFVTRKIARAAAEISLGMAKDFRLAGITAQRDWGYAPEYVEAMFRIANAAQPQDYVVATGQLHSVGQVCEICFAHVGLDFRDFLIIEPGLQRPIETTNVCGDPSAIERDLGWRAETGIQAILTEMVDHDLNALRATASPLRSHS